MSSGPPRSFCTPPLAVGPKHGPPEGLQEPTLNEEDVGGQAESALEQAQGRPSVAPGPERLLCTPWDQNPPRMDRPWFSS